MNVNALRPYLGFATIRLSENAGRSIYNGLQVNLERRFRNGLGFGVAYTLSQAPRQRLQQAEPALQRLRRQRVLGLFRQRPHAPLQRALPLRAALLAQAGHAGQEAARRLAGLGRDLLPVRACRCRSRARRTSPAWVTRRLSPGTSSATRTSTTRSSRNGRAVDQNFWFNPAAFARPAAGTFGNAGRNPGGLRGPSFWNWDIALFKNIPLGGSKRLQLRLEAFNFVNHPLVGNPTGNNASTTGGANSTVGGVNVDPNSADFGRVLTKTSERNVQLGVKFSF